MSFDSLLNHTFTILRPEPLDDDLGGRSRDFRRVENVRGRLSTTAGRPSENERGDDWISKLDLVLFVRTSADVQRDDYVRRSGKHWRVIDIKEPSLLGHHYEVQLEELDPNEEIFFHLIGSVSAVSSVTAGVIPAEVELSGTVAAQSAVTADLTATVSLSGTVDAQSAVTAGLAVQFALAGTVDAQSNTAANMVAQYSLAGTVPANGDATADLSAVVPLAGAVSAQSDTEAILSPIVSMIVTVDAQSAVTADLTADVSMSGTVDAQGDAVASLSADVPLSGTVAAVSSVTGEMTPIEAFEFPMEFPIDNF